MLEKSIQRLREKDKYKVINTVLLYLLFGMMVFNASVQFAYFDIIGFIILACMFLVKSLGHRKRDEILSFKIYSVASVLSFITVIFKVFKLY